MDNRRHTLKIVAASIGGTLLALVLGALGFIYTGVYNVAATDEHTGLVRWALQTASSRSIEARANGPIDLPIDHEALLRGFRAYNNMCVRCHGAPGVERSWIGKGIRPTGPDLRKVAAKLSPAEIVWAIEHGIKFTGMPALAPTHSRSEMLELTAFVVSLKDMTAAQYSALSDATESADDDRSQDGEQGHSHSH